MRTSSANSPSEALRSTLSLKENGFRASFSLLACSTGTGNLRGLWHTWSCWTVQELVHFPHLQALLVIEQAPAFSNGCRTACSGCSGPGGTDCPTMSVNWLLGNWPFSITFGEFCNSFFFRRGMSQLLRRASKQTTTEGYDKVPTNPT